MMGNEKTVKPYVSIVLTVINILLFFACLVFGEQIYTYGELTVSGALGRGEIWRIISSMFLHANFSHLASNMMVLFFLGGMIEETLGHVPYGIAYFLSGIGGGVLSLLYKIIRMEDIASVGASGALFGLDGLLLSMVLFLPGYRRKVPFSRTIFMIILSLYSGFSSEQIDNAAHVGGLCVGFLVGIVICLIQSRKGNYHIEY